MTLLQRWQEEESGNTKQERKEAMRLTPYNSMTPVPQAMPVWAAWVLACAVVALAALLAWAAVTP